MNPNKSLIAVLISSLVGGCAITQKGAIDNKAANIDQRAKSSLEGVMNDPAALKVRVQGSWLSPKVVSLGEDAALPAKFNNSQKWPLGMGWRDRANLRTIGERISKNTGLAVRFSPDVFQTAASKPSVPAAPDGSAKTYPPESRVDLPPAAQRPGLSVPLSAVEASGEDMEMSYTGTLADYLNRVALHFGVNWEYKDGAIHFYRYVTRIFQVNANPGDQSFNSALGKTNGGSSGSSGSNASSGNNFTSSGKVELKAEGFSIWESLKKQLDMIRTPDSRCGECGVTISQATGTILIRDTRDVVEQAANIIRHENALATQQVAVRVEIYSATANDSRDLGINWNLIFNKLTNLAPQFRLNLTSPTSLASPSSGSLGISILEPVTDGSSTLQRLSGSQALLQAMEGVANTYQLDAATAITLNRRLAPIASIDQQTYLQSTTPGSTGSGGGSALPGLTPGTVTTGLTGFFLPTVMENGNVLLTMGLDSSVLKSIGVVSTGEGATKQLINTPNVGAYSTLPQVVLKPGSTLVMSGRARDGANYNQQTLTGQVGLGGSYTGQRERSTIMIMVSVQLLPGA